MSFMAGRVFCRFKNIKITQNFLRLSSLKEPCFPKSGEIKDQKETKETKVELNCFPPKTSDSTCPSPPPCSAPPICPPRLCNVVIDETDPCKYIPPPNRDPDYPDLTRIKKLQCQFQKEKDTPVYLMGGRKSRFFFYFVLVFHVILLLKSFHTLYLIKMKS